MADYNARAGDLRAIEQRAEVGEDCFEVAGFGGIAPAEAGAIVSDGLAGFRDFILHQTPTQRRRSDAGFENYRRGTGPIDFGMQAMVSEVDHAAGGGEA